MAQGEWVYDKELRAVLRPKVVAELNRLRAALAAAQAGGADRTDFGNAVEQLITWLLENPWNSSVRWTDYLEDAIRALRPAAAQAESDFEHPNLRAMFGSAPAPAAAQPSELPPGWYCSWCGRQGRSRARD